MASSSGSGRVDEQQGVVEFMGLTGATKEVAEFHLEAAAGRLDVAVEAFYDASAAPANSSDAAMMQVGDDNDDGNTTGPPSRAVVGGGYPTGVARGDDAKKKKKRAAGNIRGFGDLANDNDDDDDNDQEANEYFTGGERSGMMVQDPNQRKKGGAGSVGGLDHDHSRRVDGLFNQALAAGADTGRPEDLGENGGGRSRMPFSGSSRTLGDSTIDPGADNAAATQSAADIVNRPVTHTITFYRNGFTVNDSNELRRMEDPANAGFLQSIAKGECPRELETLHIGDEGGANAALQRMRPVHVNLVRSMEDFVPREAPRYVAFGGTGRTLGSSSDTGNGTGANASSSAAASTGGGSGAAASVTPDVDETQPTTSLQIRLADGTRMVARFNHTHTVGDIRNFIIRSRPGAKVNFAITTSFPPTPLEDDDKTIAEAGLLNSVVQQKML